MISIQGGLSELFSKNYSEEVDLNIGALPSNSTFKKIILPQRALSLLVTRALQFSLAGRERPTAAVHRPKAPSIATSVTGQKTFPYSDEKFDMKEQT